MRRSRARRAYRRGAGPARPGTPDDGRPGGPQGGARPSAGSAPGPRQLQATGGSGSDREPLAGAGSGLGRPPAPWADGLRPATGWIGRGMPDRPLAMATRPANPNGAPQGTRFPTEPFPTWRGAHGSHACAGPPGPCAAGRSTGNAVLRAGPGHTRHCRRRKATRIVAPPCNHRPSRMGQETVSRRVKRPRRPFLRRSAIGPGERPPCRTARTPSPSAGGC